MSVFLKTDHTTSDGSLIVIHVHKECQEVEAQVFH